MAGVGPLPKDPSQRARRNKAPQLRVVEVDPGVQPDLPQLVAGGVELEWPDATLRWWAHLGEWPTSPDFTALEWDYHLETARLHALFWLGLGDKFAGEIRLRMAKIGVTPEDRARLKITFANADEAEQRVQDRKSGASGPSARERRGPLKAV